MNIAVVFAGGTGQRMNSKTKPKQFLELYGKPILVYTLEVFENHPEIDGIVLVVLESWSGYTEGLISKYNLSKVKAVVSGGDSAFESQRKGLEKVKELFGEDVVVLIHDGVRPLVDNETISKNIESVKNRGTAITVTPAVETITILDESGEVSQIIERSKVQMARAPQSFNLKDILSAHKNAESDNMEFIDSASLMKHYGYHLFTVQGAPENIKITTPNDFYTFRALVDASENSQIFGV